MESEMNALDADSSVEENQDAGSDGKDRKHGTNAGETEMEKRYDAFQDEPDPEQHRTDFRKFHSQNLLTA